MDIAVMGAGGVGGYFGGMLARAGNQVTFIARGNHLKAIRSSGLRVRHHQGEFTVTAGASDLEKEPMCSTWLASSRERMACSHSPSKTRSA